MPGWDAYPLGRLLSERFRCPALIENDCNIRAMGEAAALGEGERPIIAIKVATGIGAGIVDQYGNIFHGFDGAAGDFGHLRLPESPQIQCTCGAIGCIEASASVPAIIRRVSQNEKLPKGEEITTENFSNVFAAGPGNDRRRARCRDRDRRRSDRPSQRSQPEAHRDRR